MKTVTVQYSTVYMIQYSKYSCVVYSNTYSARCRMFLRSSYTVQYSTVLINSLLNVFTTQFNTILFRLLLYTVLYNKYNAIKYSTVLQYSKQLRDAFTNGIAGTVSP